MEDHEEPQDIWKDFPRCGCGRFARQVSAFHGEGGQELVTLSCSAHGLWTEGH